MNSNSAKQILYSPENSPVSPATASRAWLERTEMTWVGLPTPHRRDWTERCQHQWTHGATRVPHTADARAGLAGLPESHSSCQAAMALRVCPQWKPPP